jgi:5-methylcytosine-specific restriction endonuclease McrA
LSQRPPLAALLRELSERERHSPRDERVRLAARLRARDACEYCLLPTVGQFQVDHIIPVVRWDLYTGNRLRAVERIPGRRGPNHLDNFAWSCSSCNSAKGQQVAHRAGRRTSRLFDPRRDRWSDHFSFMHGYLFFVGASAIGRATAEALRFNDSRLDGPLGPRHEAFIQGHYPPAWARPHSVG